MRCAALLRLAIPILLVVGCSDDSGEPPESADRTPLAPTGRTLQLEGVEFVEIGPGSFLMGSEHGDSDERPVHRVEFPRGFWIARCEITNEQFERFDPAHRRDDHSTGDRDPVVNVNWAEARTYCAWLAGRSGRPVRLPTESEWEAACRAGSPLRFASGDDEEGLGEYAWFDENWEVRANEVGTKRPNAWGLHDLHGNVWEWCEDTWHRNYRGAPRDGSAWIEAGAPEDSPHRIQRGGGRYDEARRCRSANRRGWFPGVRNHDVGFRAAMGPLED